MAYTTNNENQIVAGTVVNYQNERYIVAEVYSTSLLIYGQGKTLHVYTEECIPE